MSSLLVALALVACLGSCHGVNTRWHQLGEHYTFEKYCQEFGKPHHNASHPEYAERKAIFLERLTRIMKHNADPSQTWKAGVNRLTDLRDAEFKSMRGYHKSLARTYRAGLTEMSALAQPWVSDPNWTAPQSVDWRNATPAVVTAVKDQGSCGSCWAVAATAAMESAYALVYRGRLEDASMQQIVSCTQNPKHCGGTGGCAGGTAQLAFNQVKNDALGMLATEWEYPYTSFNGEDGTCQPSMAGVITINGWVDLPSNKYQPLLEASATKGPIAVAVEASSWMGYEEGVFDGCSKTDIDIDHAVILVGYGTDPKGGDYWLIRNSWGVTFGEAGYIRLKRVGDSFCANDTRSHDGSACDGDPDTVKVCDTCGILYDTTYPTAG